MRPGWAFPPLLGGAIAHAPVLRYDLLDGPAPAAAKALGANKIVRGVPVMSGGTLAATAALHRLSAYRERLPLNCAPLARSATARSWAPRSCSASCSTAPSSAALALPPASEAAPGLGVALAIHDQADFVLGAWLLLAPVWRMRARDVAEAFAVVAGVHLGVNLAGYALGARSAPL